MEPAKRSLVIGGKPCTTVEEAVAILQANGHQRAKVRDWVMGHTIQLPLGDGARISSMGVNLYRSVLYICPRVDGEPGYFVLLETMDLPFESLLAATIAAHSIAASYEALHAQRT